MEGDHMNINCNIQHALIWHKELYVGGGTHVYRLFVKYLKELGFNVITITTSYVLEKGDEEESKVIVVNKSLFRDEIIKLVTKLRPKIIVRISGPLLDRVIPPVLKKNTIIINYIHFPYDATIRLMESILRLKNISLIALVDDIAINLLRALLFKRESEMDRPSENSIILTNSNFTRYIVETVWGINAYTLYPTLLEESPKPLNYDAFANKVKNLIAMLGTYTIGKRYHFIPIVAKHLRNYGIVIMGSTPSQLNKLYYKTLSLINNMLNVRNILMLSNVDESVKKYILSRSVALLHLRFFEHFGIAILEGIKYGNIPLVHTSGGQYEICKNFFPHWCRFFASVNPNDIGIELSKILDELSSYTVDELYRGYVKAFDVLKRRFSFNTFKENLDSMIKSFLHEVM